MKKAQSMLLLKTVVVSFLLSSYTWASCTLQGSIERPIDSDRGSNWTTEIDSSLPVGSILSSFRLEARDIGSTPVLTCDSPTPIISSTSGFPLHSGDIFQTGIPGIGMNIIVYEHGNELPGTYSPRLKPDGDGTEYLIVSYVIYRITLIKTGYIPSGGQIFGYPLLKSHVINHDNLPVVNSELTQPFTVVLKRATCAVNTPNFTVNLGDVSMMDFNGSNRTQPQNFSIDLTCAGGTQAADIHVTLTDANQPSNLSNQLSLAPGSTVQGIGLEVNNRYGVVSYGPELSGFGNPGQWVDGSTGVGSYSIPLSVNYVRLPGPLRAGPVNAGVTYTLNYD